MPYIIAHLRPHAAGAVVLGLLRFGTVASPDDKTELHNVSPATLEKYSALFNEALYAHHGPDGADPLITLPTAAECAATEEFYFKKYGYPGAIGSLDGKHFMIASDATDPHSYKNYFGERSLTVLAYFDQLRCIRWTSDIYPGKNGDGRLYSIGTLKRDVANGFFPPQSAVER
jgi:hypothetical protein